MTDMKIDARLVIALYAGNIFVSAVGTILQVHFHQTTFRDSAHELFSDMWIPFSIVFAVSVESVIWSTISKRRRRRTDIIPRSS